MNHLNMINWIEILVTGSFTLLGAAIGAAIAGRYAVNSVKKQLHYDKASRRIDILDKQLKINEAFSLHLLSKIETINDLFEILSPQMKNSPYLNEIAKITLEFTEDDMKRSYGSLSKLEIESLPYEEYNIYIKALEHIEAMEILSSMLKMNIDIAKEDTTENKLLVNRTYKSMKATKEDLEESHVIIKKKQTELTIEYSSLKLI